MPDATSLHIHYNPASARLTIGLLMFNALIQFKIIVGMYHQALTGILTEQKFISDCRYRVIKSSSLVPVLFREVFSHPYIPFFHLLVNGFSVILNKTLGRFLPIFFCPSYPRVIELLA